MGIEHPILGLITFTLIASMVVSAIVLLGIVGMNVQEYILRTPVTEGYATCFSQSFDSVMGKYKYNITVTIANSGIADMRLEKLYITTDKGVVELSVTRRYEVVRGVPVGDARVDFEIILQGFSRETELWAGQRGLVRLNIVSDKSLYTTGGLYLVALYLTTIDFEAFTVREARFKVGEIEECPILPPPPPETPLDIILWSRAALYWDTFDTNPLNVRMIEQGEGGGCRAGYEPSIVYDRSGLVYIEVAAQDRECALLASGVTLPNMGSIFVAYTALILNDGRTYDQPGLFGAILAWDTGLTQYYTGGFNKSGDSIFVRVKTPATTAVSSASYRVEFNKWYNGTLALSYIISNVPGYIATYASPITSVTRPLAPHEWLTPSFVGLSINKLTDPRQMKVYFDSILVTVNVPPWIVRVENLQSGWMVKLKDSSGSVVAEGVAGLGGFVELNVWGIWIIENGVIEIYDGLGRLLLQKSFSEILGGDVYRVIG